jgi:ribonuclease VapC
MKRYVLDSYALLAYAEGEEGSKIVADVFKKALAGLAEVFLCRVNWGEMYYIALREGGEERAELYSRTLSSYPLEFIETTKELTVQAARLKAFNKISYADAFAGATAILNKAELVTGDKEFKQLDAQLKVHWI